MIPSAFRLTCPVTGLDHKSNYAPRTEPLRVRSGVCHSHTRTHGSLREYIGHFRYKWCNYYVRMSKNVVWDPHERFPLGFSRWPHSVGGAECGRHSKPREKRSWGSQTTFISSPCISHQPRRTRYAPGHAWGLVRQPRALKLLATYENCARKLKFTAEIGHQRGRRGSNRHQPIRISDIPG